MRTPSPALVVASVALFLAMGGTGYAVAKLPRNSVGPKQLQRNAVTSPKIKDGAIAPADLSAAARTALTGPTGATGARGPSSAVYSPPIAGVTITGSGPVTITEMQLPAGNYAITATLTVTNATTNTSGAAKCGLALGSTTRESAVSVTGTTATPTAHTATMTITMGGTAGVNAALRMTCEKTFLAANVMITDVSITAVQVDAIATGQLAA